MTTFRSKKQTYVFFVLISGFNYGYETLQVNANSVPKTLHVANGLEEPELPSSSTPGPSEQQRIRGCPWVNRTWGLRSANIDACSRTFALTSRSSPHMIYYIAFIRSSGSDRMETSTSISRVSKTFYFIEMVVWRMGEDKVV